MIDEVELRARFHELSRRHHPDARAASEDEDRSVEGKQAEFLNPADLNQSFAVLQDPLERLRHYLALARSDLNSEGQQVGGGEENVKQAKQRNVALDEILMDLFSRVGKALQLCENAIGKLTKADSAVARALLTPERMEAVAAIQQLSPGLESEIQSRLELFPHIDELCRSGSSDRVTQGMCEAEASLGQLGFLVKWKRQLQEKFVTLASLD